MWQLFCALVTMPIPANNSPRRQRPKTRTFRPRLEVLEDRYAPATIAWTGAVSDDMTMAGNWQGNTRPGSNDEAVFTGGMVRAAQVPSGGSLTVGKLTVDSSYISVITVNGSLTVAVGNVAGNSTWASATSMTMGSGGFLNINGNGTMVFSNGGIAPNLIGGAGSLYVRGGATLSMTSAATQLGPNLSIGDIGTTGTVTIGGLASSIAGGGNVTNTANGTFKMTQTGDNSSSPKGSFDQTVTSASFTNQGTFIRDGATTGGYFPYLGYVLTNTGTFQVTAGSNLQFNSKDTNGYSLINQSGGTVALYNRSYVKGFDRTYMFDQTGGTFATYGTSVGTGRAFFYMSSVFEGGNLYVNRDTGFGSLQFGNNDATFKNAITINLSVDGSSAVGSEVADQISVTGASTLTIDNSGTTKPRLVITTLNAAPASGWAFDILTAPSLVGTFDAASITFTGSFSPPGGYTVTYPLSPSQTIHIAV